MFENALERVKSGNVRPRTNMPTSAFDGNSSELPNFSPQPTMAVSFNVPKDQ
jgi:hypothetical protein